MLEFADQLLVADAVLQNRHPKATDGSLRVKGREDLAPGVGLGHADLRRETELAQLGDRVGPTRDQCCAGKRSGQAVGWAPLGEGAQPNAGECDHHLDLTSLELAQQVMRCATLERHLAHRRHHQRHAAVTADQALQLACPPALESHHGQPIDAAVRRANRHAISIARRGPAAHLGYRGATGDLALGVVATLTPAVASAPGSLRSTRAGRPGGARA